MSNLFFDLPLPVLNGAGAAVDVSAQGGPKTVTCVGSFQGATITIEASCDGGVTYSPVKTFQNTGGECVLPLAAEYMRTNVSGRKSLVAFSANVDVGAPDTGALFDTIPLPASNGSGAAVDISTFGINATIICTGTFDGAAITVEISEDGTDWATLRQFTGRGGVYYDVLTANYVRATVSGRRSGVPFSGALSIGAYNEPGGGGGEEQRFSYTVTGLESDLENLVIPLPAARLSANYLVEVSMSTFTYMLDAAVPSASKAVAQFVLALSAPATAGDVFDFFVADPS